MILILNVIHHAKQDLDIIIVKGEKEATSNQRLPDVLLHLLSFRCKSERKLLRRDRKRKLRESYVLLLQGEPTIL